MLYSQIVLTRGLPLNLQLPARKPTAIADLSREELDAELRKGLDSMNTGRTYSPEEVMKELGREYGI